MDSFSYPGSVPFNCLYAEVRAGCQVYKSIMCYVVKLSLNSHKINVLFIDHSKHSVTESLSLFYCCCGHGISL